MGTIIGDGITFDDVLLVPSYSEVIPNQVCLIAGTIEKTAGTGEAGNPLVY